MRINEFKGLYPVETWRDIRGRQYYRINLGSLPFREDDPGKLASLILCCSVDTTYIRMLGNLIGIMTVFTMFFSWNNTYEIQPGLWLVLVLILVLLFAGLIVVRNLLARKRSLECLTEWGRRQGSAPIIYHPYRDVLRAILANAKSCSFPRCKMIINTNLGQYEITHSIVPGGWITARPIGKDTRSRSIPGR
ncbi:MAG: hypothetical protein GSR77_06760 [Desulfurococcales archaeon]|nr:hypothetical protein [Desulfurococcales archaeon]